MLTAGRTKGEQKKLSGSCRRVGNGPGFHRPSGDKHHRFSVAAGLITDQAPIMSTSRQFSESRAIPTRTVLINDTTQLPHDYCTTPGGTLFSTTPGGNRISSTL